MDEPAPSPPDAPRLPQVAAGGLAWAAGWAAMFALDGRLDAANLALLLVLASALAALAWPLWAAALASVAAIAAFNWFFVPPRHAFAVELPQHALLLGATLAVNTLVALLVVRLRRAAEQARTAAAQEARLRHWGETLRETGQPAAQAAALQALLAGVAGLPVALCVPQAIGDAPGDDATLQVGDADADQRAGLALCLREGHALGPGSGRHEDQPDLYLPLRGRDATLGAAVLRGAGARGARRLPLAHLQALCDQFGIAQQRALIARREHLARAQAQQQALRGTLLAAIAHDHRTPLASIMGAATSLVEQAERLDAAQRRRLAGVIVDEAERLRRLTDNTLQLARLDGPGVTLQGDWESAEELVGGALQRARRRDDGRRVRARLEPGLPLLWCDATLASQLLDNLLDNALRYSPPEAPVEIVARRAGAALELAVRDRGPGIPPAWRERVFEVFQRGSGLPDSGPVSDGGPAARRGAGVGLAVCRAIAHAHGGTLHLRARTHGGCAFECRLPLRDPPDRPPPEDGA